MTYDPEEDWSAASWLGAFADTLYNEYLDYWELQNVPADSSLSDRQREHFRRMYAIAQSLTPCLYSLNVSPEIVAKVRDFMVQIGVSRDEAEGTDAVFATRILHAIRAHPIIRDGVRLTLASVAADTLLAGAEERASALLALTAVRHLSPRASAFLDRATQLFLWGFEPETVVMCAAVLEAAYETRFPPELMIRLQVPKTGREYQAHEYERAALAAGIFGKSDRDLAAKIRLARNDTLHNAPNVALDARGALQSTASLLSALFPR